MAKAKHSGLPADSQVTRRNILRAAPAVGFAALVAGSVPAEAAETPVAALFREWQEAKAAEDAAFAASATGDCEACNSAYAAVREIEDGLMALPMRSSHDFFLKVAAWTNFGACDLFSNDHEPEFWAEARALVEGRA